MEKKITLDKLIIFPNTTNRQIKADYIISGRGVEAHTDRRGNIKTQTRYYMAATDIRQVYEHFWNNALSNEDKVPAITHMLYQLRQEYGCDFQYLQPSKPPTNGKDEGTGDR